MSTDSYTDRNSYCLKKLIYFIKLIVSALCRAIGHLCLRKSPVLSVTTVLRDTFLFALSAENLLFFKKSRDNFTPFLIETNEILGLN